MADYEVPLIICQKAQVRVGKRRVHRRVCEGVVKDAKGVARDDEGNHKRGNSLDLDRGESCDDADPYRGQSPCPWFACNQD